MKRMTDGNGEEHRMTKLKPCPFCGGEAKLEDMGFPHHVYCTRCGAKVTGIGYEVEGEKDAVDRWNRRVQP